jgi:hypothetical protein
MKQATLEKLRQAAREDAVRLLYLGGLPWIAAGSTSLLTTRLASPGRTGP